MPNQSKTMIRNTIKQVRSKISESYRNRSSREICTQINVLEQYQQSNNIGLYYAVNKEVNLYNLWEQALLKNKICCFPVINEQMLSFLPATLATPFKINQYGIPEPDVSLAKAIPVEQLDLIIVPLIAFDVHCTRLGMGAGYYDRTLADKKPKYLFGVAYPCQQVDFIKPQVWDIPLDAVIIPKIVYWRRLNYSTHP